MRRYIPCTANLVRVAPIQRESVRDIVLTTVLTGIDGRKGALKRHG
jgi:hypothetical protein